MTDIPATTFPFTKLKLGDGEVPLWIGYNPTFHRFFQYGLVISDRALYLCPSAWLFARWKRYSLRDISEIALGNPRERPAFTFRVGDKIVRFRTPGDSYHDEVDVDRRIVSEAVAHLKSQSQGERAAP